MPQPTRIVKIFWGSSHVESTSKSTILSMYINCNLIANRYEPELVREICHKISRAVSVPVTVKCRIGVDSKDSYEELCQFVHTVALSGVQKFVIHGRKCILKGLTPKQNRDIPPLRPEVVHRLCRDFPELKFVMNGGLQTLRDVRSHLEPYDDLPPVAGCMIGRAAYHNPFLLATVDSEFYGTPDPCLTRREVVERYLDYCDFIQSETGPLRVVGGRVQKIPTTFLLRSLQNVFVGLQGNQRYRIASNDLYIEQIRALGDKVDPDPRYIVEEAMRQVRDEDLDAPVGNRDVEKIIFCNSSLVLDGHTATGTSTSGGGVNSPVAVSGTTADRSRIDQPIDPNNLADGTPVKVIDLTRCFKNTSSADTVTDGDSGCTLGRAVGAEIDEDCWGCNTVIEATSKISHDDFARERKNTCNTSITSERHNTSTSTDNRILLNKNIEFASAASFYVLSRI